MEFLKIPDWRMIVKHVNFLVSANVFMGTWNHITFALLQRRNFLHFYFIKHIEMKESEEEKKQEFRMNNFLILMIITR